MYLAIDIGATKTLIALFSARGRLLKKQKFPTNHDENNFIKELLTALRPFTSRPITALTIAVPGVVQKNCSIIYGNLPWQNPDLFAPVRALFSCPVYIMNDADLATLYESHRHKGRSIYLTFSTGIGGGIAEDGRLSSRSASFEPGHRIYTWQGQPLEWEDFAAASAIRTHYGKNVNLLRGSATLQDIAARLTPGLIDIIKNEHPARIIIGGPLGLIFRRLKKPLLTHLKSALPDTKLPQITPAKKPTQSVIYGCYLHAKFQSR